MRGEVQVESFSWFYILGFIIALAGLVILIWFAVQSGKLGGGIIKGLG